MRNWSEHNFGRGGLHRWLHAPGSLSARLAATGEVFSVQVLNQGRQPLSQDEAHALGVSAWPAGQRVGYGREVVLRVDGEAKVFARSVTLHVNASGVWRSVRGLGNRPLADVLFARSGIERHALSFGKLVRAGRLQRHAVAGWAKATGENLKGCAMPARRSVFVRRGAALLVMEVFAAQLSRWAWSQAAGKVKKSHRRRV
jgi:chorismate--pyruvate lyase